MVNQKYLIKALMLLFVVFSFSCSGDDNDTPDINENKITSITISVDKSELLEEDSATFQINDNFGSNITSRATIYINGNAINQSKYKFSDAGEYQVYAQMNELKSQTITIKTVASTHTTKIMVEDYTGTWCGYCPRLAFALEEAVSQNQNIIPVALHDDNDMFFEYVLTMENKFSITGFPSGRVNRTIVWNETAVQLNGFLEGNKPLGLAINSSLASNMLSVEVKVHYDLGTDERNKLIVYLLENGLIYPQANYYNEDASSPWYQKGNPIANFVHDHVARKSLTNIFGDEIPTGSTNTGSTYSKSFNIPVPANIHNSNNLELVAFVVNANDTVINVQKATVGISQDFD